MAKTKSDGSTKKIEKIDSGGKFLTFRLGDENYGLGILKVHEIIGMMNITRMPNTPDYIKGIINLRGSVIPVTDLRKKFGMSEVKDTEETCIIVVDMSEGEVGMIVDKVSEVVDITSENIEESPKFSSDTQNDFIFGIGKSNDNVIILLDIEKVLSSKELTNIQTTDIDI